MIDIEIPADAPAEFRLAVESLRSASVREELVLEQIEAPGKLAKHEVAFSANVDASATDVASDLGTGRFVLLWDPEEPEPWQSRFRVITFAKSPLDRGKTRNSLVRPDLTSRWRQRSWRCWH